MKINESKTNTEEGSTSELTRIVRRMEDCMVDLRRLEQLQHREFVIWSRRHIKADVWVISTDAELILGKHYTPTPGSDFPTKHLYIHDKWKPDSLYRYLVHEQPAI